MPSYYEDSPPSQDQSAQGSSHTQGPPRKRMRKGTKSCLECRRRKIKCTFETASSAICKECYARGSACVDQEHGEVNATSSTSEQSYSLRERVTDLEGLVKQVLDRLPEGTEHRLSATSSADTQSAAEVLKSLRNISVLPPAESPLSLPSGLRDEAPALTLFDNAVITRSDDPLRLPKDRKEKNKMLARALTAMLPGPHELDLLLDASTQWWTAWGKMFPAVADRKFGNVKESILSSLRSENPPEVAKMILCLAISIDQLPGDWDFSKLHLDTSPQELMERYISTVDQLITSDDEIAATADGVECLCLQAKYYVNVGRPRRAWLLFRRAISFAQLLGLHRVALMRPNKPTPEHKRLLHLWTHLFQGDRYMALTLGLPYTIQPEFCDPCIPAIGEPTEMSDPEVFMLRMTPLAAGVVDRNQKAVPDFSTTLRIEQEMEQLAQTVPSDWWGRTDSHASSVEEEVDRLLAQFFYHLIRKLLHLPFMLKSPTDKRYEYSYSAALESSRGVLRFYDALRGVNAVGPYICKVVDFQAFNAAMLILLHLYGDASGSYRNVEQDQSDSALVDTTIIILRKASKEAGGIVAAQSLKALEMMAEARHGCPGSHTETIKIAIPYFGTIKIAAGKNFRAPTAGTYPRTEPRSQSLCSKSPAMEVPSNLGLPTPPSAPGSISHFSPPALTTDPSCSSGNTSVLPSPYIADSLSFREPSGPQPQSKDNQFIAGGNTFADDPLITFDSYMANPPFGGSMDMGYGNEAYPMGMTPGTIAPGSGADLNSMSGFPWLGAGLDLDTSWNWVGNDGFSMPGNN